MKGRQIMIRLPLILGVLALLGTSPLGAQTGPVFPSRLDLEKQWESFLGKEITAASLTAILKEDPDGGQLVRWGDARHTSIWAAVQRETGRGPQTGRPAAMTRTATPRPSSNKRPAISTS